MDLSMEIDEDEDITKVKKGKTTKTNRSRIDDDDGDGFASSRKRDIRGIILSVTKPSYTLKRGIGQDLRSLRCEHRNKLRYLLRQLIRRQNWDEASGVLSVLLKGTHKENNLSTNRTKYWATLELIEHMGVSKTKTRKLRHVYEMWMKKNFAFTKNRRSVKGRYDVQLEFLLFCISQEDTDGAYQALISFLQETDFTTDPISNLVAGLVFSHLWYNSIKKEINFQDSHESTTSNQLEMSRGQQSMLIDDSNGHCVVKVEDSDSGSALDRDSNTSIRLGKSINQDRMEVDHNIKKEILPKFEDLHMNSGESDQTGNSLWFPHTGNKSYGSVFYADDLESFLMPLRFPTNSLEEFVSFTKRIDTGHYKAAVKHLRGALHSTPPAYEALLPLIQMLLFADRVKEAIEEVENVVQNSEATLPFRLKASLIDHFSNDDKNKMCVCFEDTLNKDPTCSHSLEKLIEFHNSEIYSTEKLLEMIGLHLDATYAECHIWWEFASCFIKLSQCDEDRMSSCYGEKESYKKHSENTPDIFKDKLSSNNWRIRCRWWLTRHFTQTILSSEVASGDMKLVACKAASACHLYGPEVTYVVKACKYLKKVRSQERSFLKMHLDNAIGLYTA